MQLAQKEVIVMNTWKRVFACATLIGFCMTAKAGYEGPFTVVSVLQDATNYGGCMARLSGGNGALTALGYSCPEDPMVTFDCKGVLGSSSKADGTRNFSAAQLALVSGSTVRLVVDDTKKINGFCYSRRIDVFAQ